MLRMGFRFRFGFDVAVGILGEGNDEGWVHEKNTNPCHESSLVQSPTYENLFKSFAGSAMVAKVTLKLKEYVVENVEPHSSLILIIFNKWAHLDAPLMHLRFA